MLIKVVVVVVVVVGGVRVGVVVGCVKLHRRLLCDAKSVQVQVLAVVDEYGAYAWALQYEEHEVAVMLRSAQLEGGVS